MHEGVGPAAAQEKEAAGLQPVLGLGLGLGSGSGSGGGVR